MKVAKGNKVKIEYTGKLSDGAVFDASKTHGQPLEFEVGSGMVIPGFDKAVEGMELNEEKTVTIPVTEAYGESKAELMQEVPRDKLPKEPEPKEGMMLAIGTPDGRQIPARIAKVAEDKVTIDLNHPLAGKELTFEIKVVGIDEGKKEEKAEGVKEEAVEEKKIERTEDNKEESTEEKKEAEEKVDEEKKVEEKEEEKKETEKSSGEEETAAEKKKDSDEYDEDGCGVSSTSCPGCH
ncbi:MAG: peptidylprolyl isomerase [Candidatus Woesearchaeota archaeon]